MRVLMLHNRYRMAGGEDRATRADLALLRRLGADVVLDEFDNTSVERWGIGRAGSAIWSREAYRAVRRRLVDGRFDVLHVQNFFPGWSPAVHHAGRDAGVAVVQTLHNYRLACLPATFFRAGRDCTDCLGRLPLKGIWHGCYRGSRGASAVIASMVITHRTLNTWQRCVDRFIAPSRFILEQMSAAGLPRERFVVRPHTIDAAITPGDGAGGYILYAGRLSPEKGIEVLLEAWERASDLPPLLIAGEGPLAARVDEAAARHGHIRRLGLLANDEVRRLMADATAVITPSLCREVFGLAALEAFAVATPVLASDVGGLSELIEDGVNGRLFKAGDAEALARVARELAAARDHGLRARAHATFAQHYAPAITDHLLLDVYGEALSAARCRA